MIGWVAVLVGVARAEPPAAPPPVAPAEEAKPEGPLPGEPVGCRPPEAVRPVAVAVASCLAGLDLAATQRLRITLHPDGHVTAAGVPARAACLDRAAAALQLDAAACTVVVSYPVAVDPR